MRNYFDGPVRAFSTLLVMCCAFVGTTSAQPPSVLTSGAWVGEPLKGRTDTAAFVVIENRSAVDRALVGASTDAAEKVELHEMRMDAAMMRMSPVQRIALPAGGKVELKPGGLHLMLFGLKKPPAPGDEMALKLMLDDGTSVTLNAPVRRREGMR